MKNKTLIGLVIAGGGLLTGCTDEPTDFIPLSHVPPRRSTPSYQDYQDQVHTLTTIQKTLEHGRTR